MHGATSSDRLVPVNVSLHAQHPCWCSPMAHASRTSFDFTFLDVNEANLEEARDEYNKALATAQFLEEQSRDRRQVVKPAWKVVAILCALFSGNWTLPQIYLRNKAWHTSQILPDSELEFNPELMQAWLRDAAVKAKVAKGLVPGDDKYRFLAEQFLIHSVLITIIQQQNRKGLSLPYSLVLWHYVKLWDIHGRSALAAKHLDAILYGNKDHGKNWARALRQDWPIGWGALVAGKDLEEELIVRRVLALDSNQPPSYVTLFHPLPSAPGSSSDQPSEPFRMFTSVAFPKH